RFHGPSKIRDDRLPGSIRGCSEGPAVRNHLDIMLRDRDEDKNKPPAGISRQHMGGKLMAREGMRQCPAYMARHEPNPDWHWLTNQGQHEPGDCLCKRGG